jgi:mRNA interferase MazF
MGRYCPQRGELVWLNFSPQAGHEQGGGRPALVLSPAAYNLRTELALVCPVTGKVKNYPFEVALPVALPVTGVVLADQIKCADWKRRRARRICQVDEATIEEVLEKISALLWPET